jgi:bacterioferritin
MNRFAMDVESLRRRAREQMDQGAVTSSYQADPKEVVAVLNTALATELVCVLRYKAHYFMAQGAHSEAARKEFLEHAAEEQAHADRLAERITQLGGEPDLNPAGLADRSHSQYHSSGDVVEMLREDLIAERIAIASYSEIIRWLGDRDPTSRRMMEEILAVEEEHAEDLISLLGGDVHEGQAARGGNGRG